MAEEQTKKILEIQVNYQQAIKGIAEYESKLKECRDMQKYLGDALKEGVISQKEYDEQMAASRIQIKQLKTEQASLIKQVQQNVKAENAEKESLVQLRARLSNLTAEYDAMSAAERKAAAGTDLQTRILQVTNQLKEAEFATERFYRNVGNYEKGSADALDALKVKLEESKQKYKELIATEGDGSKAAQELKASIQAQEAVLDSTGQYILNLQSSILPFNSKLIPLLSNGLKGVKEAFVLAGQGAQVLGKQLLALMANPIVAFLGLIAAAIAVVVKGIASSEENMNKWRLIMTPVQRGLAALQSVIQTLCGWILNLVAGAEGLLGFLFKIGELLPVVGGAFKSVNEEIAASIELEREKIAIEKQERVNTVQNAKDALEVAKLRSEAQDKEKKTAEERLAANQKAQKILEEQADREVELAERKWKALKQEAEWADNDASMNDKLAQAEAAVYQAREKQYQQTLRLQKQEQSLRSEIQKEQDGEIAKKKEAAEKAVQNAQERAKKEQEALRAAEDAMLELVKDQAEKRRTQIQISYEREIEDLKKRLETEKNLTVAAKEAINQLIQAKEAQKANELADLEEQISNESIQRKQEEIELRLEIVKKGTDAEFDLKMQQIALSRDAEMAAAEAEFQNAEELAERKRLLQEKFANQEAELNKEREQKIFEEQKLDQQNRLTELMMEAQNNSVETARIQLEQRQMELEELHQMEDESNAEFYARQLQAQKNYNDAKKALVDQENKVTETKLQFAENVTKGLSSLLDAFGEENKAFAKASKILALAEVAINTGKAIAAGVAQAQSVPYPANLAAIGTTITTVLTNVATAISTIKSAKFAKGGKVKASQYYLADGGKIRGAGTGTSDSIPAMLSNGEFVVTAAATRIFEPMLKIMNDIGRGVSPQLSTQMTMGSASPDFFTESIAASMADVHPVVSVVDINEGQKRVQLIDSLDTL